MLLKEFIKLNIDIDVCDDYDESLYIAFCGSCKLTKEGKEYYEAIMNLNVEVNDDIAIVEVEDNEQLLNLAIDFFNSFAGYTGNSRYKRLFDDDLEFSEEFERKLP